MDNRKIVILIMFFTLIAFIIAGAVTMYVKNPPAVEAGSPDAGGQSTELEIGAKNDAPPLPVWEASGDYIALDKLILVNKENPIARDFVPDDLVRPDYCATNRSESDQYLTREAADALNKLALDAQSEGHEIVVTTAYRSYNLQNYLYNKYVEKDGQALADTYSARPGTSEHQTGLAVDVSSPSVNYELTRAYGETAEGKWLAENSWKYGFIIRYQEGKEHVTGYTYEPWHLRYVGQEAAREIYDRDMTLEEYLDQ